MTRNLKGILAMCAAMALFVANDTLVKLATVHAGAHQILLLRGLFASAFVLTAVFWTGMWRHWKEMANRLLLLRCLLEVFVAYTFIIALGVLAIADLTAILLLSPLIITAISALALKETVRWRRWAAVIIGFVGMLLVVRPGGSGFQLAALLGVASTLGVALRDLVTRRLDRGLPTLLVAAAGILSLTFFGGLLSLGLPWTPVDTRMVLLLAGAALTVLLGNVAIIIAFRDVDVSAVSPFRYTVIVWAVLAGIIIFGDIPEPAAWLGILLIAGSGLYTLYRETRLARSS
jgi:drug/metabolite transporter (DMT)-like permease